MAKTSGKRSTAATAPARGSTTKPKPASSRVRPIAKPSAAPRAGASSKARASTKAQPTSIAAKPAARSVSVKFKGAPPSSKAAKPASTRTAAAPTVKADRQPAPSKGSRPAAAKSASKNSPTTPSRPSAAKRLVAPTVKSMPKRPAPDKTIARTAQTLPVGDAPSVASAKPRNGVKTNATPKPNDTPKSDGRAKPDAVDRSPGGKPTNGHALNSTVVQRPSKLVTPSDAPRTQSTPAGSTPAGSTPAGSTPAGGGASPTSSAPVEAAPTSRPLVLMQGPVPSRLLTKKGTFAPVKPGPNGSVAAAVAKPLVKRVKRPVDRSEPQFVVIQPPAPAVRTSDKASKNQAGLSASELDFFRDLLLGDMSSMEREALRENGSDLSSLPLHMADQGTDAYEQEFTLHLVEKDRGLLRELNDALAKIQNGTYGICEGTGNPISKPRLEAQPWARHSIEYARQIEKRQMPFRR